MIRLLLVLGICYLAYNFYQKSQKEDKVKRPSKAKIVSDGSCPNPKTFVDYVEGRITGKQKDKIREHIDNCKGCMDALGDIFAVRKAK